MKRNILILGVLVIAFIGVGGAWLYAQQASRSHSAVLLTNPPSPALTAQVITRTTPSANLSPATTTPTVGNPVATPSMITVNASSPVTVTVQITDPTLIPGSVNLLLLGTTGTQPTILGVMQSTGNGIYSLQPVFNETAPGQLQLEVSAAFRGLLKRVISPLVQIPVWSVLADTSSGFAAAYPPNLYNLTDSTSTSLGLFLLESSPLGVDIGGDGPDPGSNATTTGFSIIIQQTPYSGSFNINSWLAAAAPGSEIGTLTTTTIARSPAYEVIFENQVGAGRPTLFTYHGGYIYQISYASTFPLGSVADQGGLDAFNSVVGTFTFTK